MPRMKHSLPLSPLHLSRATTCTILAVSGAMAGTLLSLGLLLPQARAHDRISYSNESSALEHDSIATRGLSAQLNMSDNVYRINAGDTLNVSVYNQADLTSGGVLVRSDGYATFNGIGELPIAGKTMQEVTRMLENSFKDLVRDPIVSLSIADVHPPTIYLGGAIMKPGVLLAATIGANNAAPIGMMNDGRAYLPKMDYRLSSILAASGGVMMNADLSNVLISRGGKAYRTVDLWALVKNGDPSQDLMLQNGDSIFVPPLPNEAMDDASYQTLLRSSIGPRTFPVRVIGDVRSPGVFDLEGLSPYLSSAIAKGGGFNVGGNRRRVAIRRFTSDTKFTTLFIDPSKTDFMLRPNDVVYIPEQKVSTSGNYMTHVSKILSPFTSISSTLFSYALLKQY